MLVRTESHFSAMVFSASLPFTTVSLARPNNTKTTRNNTKPTLRKLSTPPKPNPLPSRRLKHSGSSPLPPVAGGEAFTYTRLPPIDDQDSPSLDFPAQSSTEVKLSDITITNFLANRPPAIKQLDEEEDEFEARDSKPEFDYGKFELFEVGSDEDDEEDDEEYDYEGEQILGFEDEPSENENTFVGEDFEEGIDEDEATEKEKGVPAVMRCFDRAKVFAKAGDGGNGVVAIRREKFVPLGGPSGGDGGRGGNIFVEVDRSMNSLLSFRQSIHFRAGRGQHGRGKKQNGAKGEDVVIKVPPGTVIREAVKDGVAQGEILLELLHPGQRALVLPGGRGGRGNASFKSGTNRVPRIAENGEEGPEMWLELELKLVADVGIVGVPNAGKSTFLSVISAADPNIANYPFTTLLPNLGVVSFGYDATIVVADLPGLLEGAHRGFGLGHEFLRHTERCSVLVHIVDGSSQQPEYEFDAVRLELEMFSPELAEKPYIVAYNKMDLPDAYDNWLSFKESLNSRGIKPFCMSAVSRQGTQEVITSAYELVCKRNQSAKVEGWNGAVNLNHVAEMVHKQRIAPINDFEISHNSASNTWTVLGTGLQRFVQMTNWKYIDSDKRFQNVLEACGVYKSLTKLGVKEGDTVIIGEMEMVWHNSPNGFSGASSKKKESTDTVKWPQWT